MEQVTRPLTEQEIEFRDVFVEALTLLSQIHEKAHAVVATGGDCREAFLSAIDDPNERMQAAEQWPMLSMMLGV